jgi:hypothetical protein
VQSCGSSVSGCCCLQELLLRLQVLRPVTAAGASSVLLLQAQLCGLLLPLLLLGCS